MCDERGRKPRSPQQQTTLPLWVEFKPLIVPCVCGSAQLYEQILAENEKLKAQLRDTDLELADLKLQLEKATQVRAAGRATAAAAVVGEEIPDLCPLLSFQRQERYADRSQLEMEKRVKRLGSAQSSCTGTCVTCVCV